MSWGNIAKGFFNKYLIKPYMDSYRQSFEEKMPEAIKSKLTDDEIQTLTELSVSLFEEAIEKFKEKMNIQ